MRLLIGWIIRGILVAAAASAVIAWAVNGQGSPFLPVFWWTWLVTSIVVVIHFIADYLIDYDEWQRQAGKR